MCRRAVRVKSQLTSHKRFADAFLTYCQLVDNARLYSTNSLEAPPKVHIFHISYSCPADKNMLFKKDQFDRLRMYKEQT